MTSQKRLQDGRSERQDLQETVKKPVRAARPHKRAPRLHKTPPSPEPTKQRDTNKVPRQPWPKFTHPLIHPSMRAPFRPTKRTTVPSKTARQTPRRPKMPQLSSNIIRIRFRKTPRRPKIMPRCANSTKDDYNGASRALQGVSNNDLGRHKAQDTPNELKAPQHTSQTPRGAPRDAQRAQRVPSKKQRYCSKTPERNPK
jgi:hypothetical protein